MKYRYLGNSALRVSENSLGIKQLSKHILYCIFCRPAVTSVIIGASHIKQFYENTGGLDWQLIPEDVEYLDNLSKPIIPYPVWEQDLSDDR